MSVIDYVAAIDHIEHINLLMILDLYGFIIAEFDFALF